MPIRRWFAGKWGLAVAAALWCGLLGVGVRAWAQAAVPPPASDAAKRGILVTCVSPQSPAVAHVAAAIRTDPDRADNYPITCRYSWDFGDPEGRWNTLPGWNAAHVYDKPGKYTITLTITDTDTGQVTRETSWVRVLPDERRRVHVAADGNDRATGATPAAAVRTAARAFQLARADAVVLFRKGDVFDVSAPINLSVRNVRVASYDRPAATADADRRAPTFGPAPDPAASTAKPVLRKTTGPPRQDAIFIVSSRCENVLFEGIEFDSIWPLTSSLGPKKVPARAFTVGGSNFAVRDCSFRNLTDAINSELKPVGLLIQDCSFTREIRGCCYWGNGTDHVVVGNTMRHSRQEHHIRCSEPGMIRLLIAHNDLTRPNNFKGGIELREASWFYVAANHINGGTLRVGPQDNGVNQAARPDWPDVKCTWGVVQDNRVEGIPIHVRLGSEHIMVRNNIVRMVNDKGSAEWGILAACDKPGWDHIRKLRDLIIERNTVINESNHGDFLFVQGRPRGLAVRNNLYIAPHIGDGGRPGSAVHVTDPEMNGIDQVANNVYPAGAGGAQRIGKSTIGKQAWDRKPMVQQERYEDVTLDADDNPPAGLNAGARLGPKPPSPAADPAPAANEPADAPDPPGATDDSTAPPGSQ